MDKSKWTYKKLGEVATFVNGYAFKPSDWKDQGLPIIRIQNLTNSDAPYNYYDGNDLDNKYFVDNGDLLVSWSATLGAFLWNKGKAVLNQHIFKTVFDKTDINKHFLKYAIISTLNVMATKAHGITMRHITKKEFDNIAIPFPSISIQQHIVSELDQLSELISLKQQQLKEYDALAQSLFYEIFGDPKFNEKNFEVKGFDEIATATTGITYKPENVSESGIIVLRSSNIQESELDFKDIVRVDLDIRDKYIVHEGDILMCSRNGSARLVGKATRIPKLSEKMTWGAFMTIIKSEYNDYLLPYFKTDAFRNSISNSKTSTVHQITINMLRKLRIPVPPLNLQRDFASKVQAINAQKVLVKQSIAETQTLLDSRMQEYFG